MKIEFDNCPKCGSEIKREDNSLHVWEMEYQCGLTMVGVIDTQTHGDEIEIISECSKNINYGK
jgi:hypothetical protein